MKNILYLLFSLFLLGCIDSNFKTQTSYISDPINSTNQEIIDATGPVNNQGTEYYISPTGSDINGNGTTEAPWATLDKAFNMIQGGDTIILKDGIYTGDANKIDNEVPSGTDFNTSITGANGNFTTIKAEHDHMATLDGTGFRLEEIDNVLIQGLRIIKTGGKLDACEHITIRRCAIHLNTTSHYGVTFSITATYPEYTVKAKRILLEESWFWGEGRYASYFHITENSTVRRCVFRTDAGVKPHDDPNYGFEIYGG